MARLFTLAAAQLVEEGLVPTANLAACSVWGAHFTEVVEEIRGIDSSAGLHHLFNQPACAPW